MPGKVLAFVEKWQHQPTTVRRQVHITASEVLEENAHRLERQVSKTVSRLIRQVKVKSGLRLLLKSEGTVLDVSSPAGDGDTQAVFDVLKEKHPRKAQVSTDAIVNDEGKVFHPVIFDSMMVLPSPMELQAHQDWMQVLGKECAPYSNTTWSPWVTVYLWLRSSSAQGTSTPCM